MASREELEALLRRVEAATDGDNVLSLAVCLAVVGENFYADVSTSLDAALALVERVLPGMNLKISILGKGYSRAKLSDPAEGDHTAVGGAAGANPALACIVALLRALTSQSPQER